MRRHLTFLLLAGVVALSACRSKPKQKVAELPEEPPVVGHSGKVRLRSVESESEAGKASAGRAKPKAGVPEAAPAAPVMKKVIEPKPPIVAKPDSAPIPSPAPSQPPKVQAVEVAKPGGSPVSAPDKVPAAKTPVQPSAASPPAEAGQGSRPPAVKPVPPPGALPAPVLSTAGKPSAAPLSDEPLPKTTRTAKPADGRAGELSLPAKPQATAPATEPLRSAIPPAAAVPAKPAAVGPMLGLVGVEPRPRVGDSRPLPLPTGSAGTTNAAAPPLALQVGSGTNIAPATNDVLRAIGVDPLLQGTAWREQQLARQAAEQKAREEEQRKLKGALYRFLFKGGTN